VSGDHTSDAGPRYVVLTLRDAQDLGTLLRLVEQGAPVHDEGRLLALALGEGLRHDTGDDAQEIADLLQRMPICGACSREGVASRCEVTDARKLGRRLRRLLERARARRGVWSLDDLRSRGGR
jgi:hypothetical protein